MFYARQDSQATDPGSFVVRVKNVSASAAQGVGTAAQSAAVGVNKGVRQGVYSARVWAAPRLESAADYTTATVAPKVSSALRTSAQQVRPEDLSKQRSHSMLTWSLVAAAVAATAGAVTYLVRYRYRASMAAGDEEFPGGTADSGTAGTETATSAQDASGAPGAPDAPGAPADADAGVNGRVPTSG